MFILSVLERGYQSHVFHGDFLKNASNTFDMCLYFCGYVIIALSVITNL